MIKGIHKLSEGVIYRAFDGGNCGAVIDEGRALLIDTPVIPSQAREWRLSLEEMGVKEIAGIVNTDYHPEHFLGNAAFMPAPIWGHEYTIKQVNRYKSSFGDQVANLSHDLEPRQVELLHEVDVVAPTLSVDDRATLYWPNHEIQILFLDGHTSSSLGVFLAQGGVLFAGDNVVAKDPPAMAQADSKAWLEALERIKDLAPATIIPGVGAPCTIECVDQLFEYINEMRTRVTELYKAGASRRECVEKVNLEGYYPLTEDMPARIRRRQREAVERVYAEVRAELRHK